MLPEKKAKYEEYRQLLQLVNDSNAAPVVESENDLNNSNDIEMPSQLM